jgi:DNA-binding response OmpR family regulator
VANILFIDDDLTVLDAVQTLFESKGYRVLRAPNGAKGIEISRKYQIDAVVLGFTPTKDANQVADVLAKERPKLPVVIRSDFPDDTPESLKWFADALWQTDAAPEALLCEVENLIVDNREFNKVSDGELSYPSEVA